MTDLEDMNRARAEQESRAIKAEDEVRKLIKELDQANRSVEWQAKRANGWRQRAEKYAMSLGLARIALRKVEKVNRLHSCSSDTAYQLASTESLIIAERFFLDKQETEKVEYLDYIRQLEAVYIAVAKHCENCPMESDEALGKALNDVVMPADRR